VTIKIMRWRKKRREREKRETKTGTRREVRRTTAATGTRITAIEDHLE
jgi:hypothetical protein